MDQWECFVDFQYLIFYTKIAVKLQVLAAVGGVEERLLYSVQLARHSQLNSKVRVKAMGFISALTSQKKKVKLIV